MRYAIAAPTPLSEFSRVVPMNDFDFTVSEVRVAGPGENPRVNEVEMDLLISRLVVRVFIRVSAKRL